MVPGSPNWQSAFMTWMGRPDEVAALGLVLDRTYAEVAAVAEQPRRLDREFLVGQLDVWDKHLVAAVAAAGAPLRSRRAAALAVWRSIGSWAGAAQHAWLRDQLAALGLDAAALLGPSGEPWLPSQDLEGHLLAVPAPLTPESVALMLADYDLVGGDFEGARIEVDAAEPPRVRGYLALSASARRYTATPGPRPELQFHCREVTSFEFPHVERGAAHLSGPPAITVEGAGGSIEAPASGCDIRLAGRNLTYYPDDSRWHESAAARVAVADARAAELPKLPEQELPPGPLGTLTMVQRLLFTKLRMVRHPDKLRRWELAAAGALCAGLGLETIRIASRLGPQARRERAAADRFDRLVETSEGWSRTLLRDAARRLAVDVPGAAGPAPPVPVRITIGTAAQLLDDLDFDGGRLRFVDFSADRGPGQADTTVLHLDARRAGHETIVVVVLNEPLGRAPLTVTPEGLTVVGQPRLEATADEVALTIPLPAGDWTTHAAAGSWYVD